MHVVLCNLGAGSYYKRKTRLISWPILVERKKLLFLTVLINLLRRTPYCFTYLLSISVCGKMLANNASVNKIYYLSIYSKLLFSKRSSELKVDVLLFSMQATVPVIVHFPESVVQTASGTSHLLMVVFGSLLGILGLIIIMLILYIYKQ